jgi:hypothetical protein
MKQRSLANHDNSALSGAVHLPNIFYIAQLISEADGPTLREELRDLVCCALCGCPTPWKESGSFGSDQAWTLIRDPFPLDLFGARVAGAEFYRRVATSIYNTDLIGIWCPDCAAARTVSTTTQADVS